jgi:glycosyltransferase involved in cell wall biosynthesis
MTSRSLLVIVNDPMFFLSHRLPVAIAAKKAGYIVHIATAAGSSIDRIKSYGLKHHVLPLTRSGRNPFSELKAIWSIWRLMYRLQPDIVHLVTIKPVLYGGIAARLSNVSGVVAAVSGLGTVFMAQGVRARLLRKFVNWLYRIALGHPNIRVIFQNPEDRSVLLDNGALNLNQTVLIRGSGVSLAEYPLRPEPVGVPVVVLAARLLRDKGVGEFVEAARLLHSRGVQARFRLIGSQDPGNPTTITEDELNAWRQEGEVELLGYRVDIPKLFSEANIVTLPSYYGEGLPKVLIEAAACGRAVVTTDHPGCRDAIEPEKTGLLVPVRDPAALAAAIEMLIQDGELRHRMGQAGRTLAEREFTVESVVDAHLNIYKELFVAKGCDHGE